MARPVIEAAVEQTGGDWSRPESRMTRSTWTVRTQYLRTHPCEPRERTMPHLTDFPSTREWPPRFPDRIQLYSVNTPNGVKASIMLEETGLAYEPHLVDFQKNDQKS